MPQKSKIKAIFFDFDGTLVDSIQLLYEVYISFLYNYGIKGSYTEFKSLNGPSIREVIMILKRRYNLSLSNEMLFSAYDKLLREFYSSKLQLRPHVKELLNYCKTKGFFLYLVTSAEETLIKQFLQKSKLENFFTGFTFGNEISKSKPDPEIYLFATGKFNYNEDEILVIEDSENGINAASNAKLKVCAIEGTHPAAFLKETKAEFIVSNMKELKKVLKVYVD